MSLGRLSGDAIGVLLGPDTCDVGVALFLVCGARTATRRPT